MSYQLNVFTGQLDLVRSLSILDDRYVNVPGDTMTGALTITPTSGTTALTANKDIILKAGQKMIYDGA